MIELLGVDDPDPHVVKIKAALGKVAKQSSLGMDKGPLQYPYSLSGYARDIPQDFMIAGRGEVFKNPMNGYLGMWPISPENTTAGRAVVVFDDPDNVRVVRALSVEDRILTYEWGDRKRKSWVWIVAHQRAVLDTPDAMPSTTEASAEVERQATLITRIGAWLETEAEEQDWCDEFEAVCKVVGLDAVRKVRLVEVRLTLEYTLSATDLDSILASCFGGEHDVSDSFDVESSVILSDIPQSDAESADMDDHLREAGYSGWSSYNVDEWEEV